MFKKVLCCVVIGLVVIIVVLVGVQLYLLWGILGKVIIFINLLVKYFVMFIFLILGWGGNMWIYMKLIDYYQD